MPVPGFFASFADKAQSAINASPLGALNTKPGAEGSVGYKSTFDSIHNQLRVFGQQYSSATPTQKIVTAEKGVALDFDSLSHNSKYQSKVLYTWGQSEPEDLKDVTDRLAYLNFINGSLADSLAQKLHAARTPLKALRDAENALAPRRALRTNLHNQIVRLEHEKGSERKLAELREMLRNAELEDEDEEKGIEIMKRRAIKESEAAKWAAIREYGEKLVLVAQAATPIIDVLPAIPASLNNPYTGAQTTAAARASLQRALDNYQTGLVNLPFQSASDLSRSDTRSFGESHATELSRIDFPQPSVPNSPPQTGLSIPGKGYPTPVDPSNLNQSPTLLPKTSLPPAAQADPLQPPAAVPAIAPTIAETGIPVSTGPEGPGPARGSLLDVKGKLPETHSAWGANLAVDAGTVTLGRHETAEKEKERLAKEEKEKSLAAEQGNAPSKNEDEELPPYQDIA